MDRFADPYVRCLNSEFTGLRCLSRSSGRVIWRAQRSRSSSASRHRMETPEELRTGRAPATRARPTSPCPLAVEDLLSGTRCTMRHRHSIPPPTRAMTSPLDSELSKALSPQRRTQANKAGKAEDSRYSSGLQPNDQLAAAGHHCDPRLGNICFCRTATRPKRMSLISLVS